MYEAVARSIYCVDALEVVVAAFSFLAGREEDGGIVIGDIVEEGRLLGPT